MSCSNCPLPCGHPRDNWWYSWQIKYYCWAQIMFLLAGYGSLEANRWPPQKSGYIVQGDANIQETQLASDGKTVAVIKADLDLRIAKLPRNIRRILFDIDWERDWYLLSPESRDIVNYLKGWEAKELDFVHWKAGRNRDYKSHKKCVIKK